MIFHIQILYQWLDLLCMFSDDDELCLRTVLEDLGNGTHDDIVALYRAVISDGQDYPAVRGQSQPTADIGFRFPSETLNVDPIWDELYLFSRHPGRKNGFMDILAYRCHLIRFPVRERDFWSNHWIEAVAVVHFRYDIDIVPMRCDYKRSVIADRAFCRYEGGRIGAMGVDDVGSPDFYIQPKMRTPDALFEKPFK
jgi:hypothetical protein